MTFTHIQASVDKKKGREFLTLPPSILLPPQAPPAGLLPPSSPLLHCRVVEGGGTSSCPLVSSPPPVVLPFHSNSPISFLLFIRTVPRKLDILIFSGHVLVQQLAFAHLILLQLVPGLGFAQKVTLCLALLLPAPGHVLVLHLDADLADGVPARQVLLNVAMPLAKAAIALLLLALLLMPPHTSCSCSCLPLS